MPAMNLSTPGTPPKGPQRYIPLVVCTLFAALGCFLLLKAHSEDRFRAALLTEGVATEGTVSQSFQVKRSASQQKKDQRLRYASIIEYRDLQGQIHSLRLEGEQEKARNIGEQVSVLYSQAEPGRGLIVGHEQEGLFALRLVGGLLIMGSLLVFSLLQFRAARRRRQN